MLWECAFRRYAEQIWQVESSMKQDITMLVYKPFKVNVLRIIKENEDIIAMDFFKEIIMIIIWLIVLTSFTFID